MEFVIDIIMEFIIEFFGEVYVTLATSLMPNKALSKRLEKTLTIIFTCVGIVFFSLLIAGLILLIGNKGVSTLGWIFTGFGLVFLVISILLRLKQR